MIQALIEIFNYRDLLFMLTLRDIRIRYKQAAMGFVWAIFMPIVAVCAGLLIKKAMAVVSQQTVEFKDLLSLSVKVLPWTFFISSLRFCVQSLVGNNALVTKIYFPKAVLPLSSILACFLDFLISVLVLIVLFIFFRVDISIHILWVPFLIFILFLLTAGLGFILAAANLFFRDVKYIVEVFLMFGIFFTPVFYEAKTFGNWENLLLMNPVGSILESLRDVVVMHQMPQLHWLIYAVVSSLLIFVFGMYIFHSKESQFAENI